MANARVDQFVLEIVALSQPTARVDQFVLELATIAAAPIISCGNPPAGQVGVAYTHTFPVVGVPPYVFSIVVPQLPPGLTLNTTTGVVSGVPTLPGTFTFTIQVTDAALQSSQVTCQIVIAGAGLKITLRGVKRFKKCRPAEDLTPCEVPPKVERAV